jgi:type VI protein secretion system component Hcp
MTNRFWNRVRFGLKPKLNPRRTHATPANARLTIEALEARTLLSATPSVTLALLPAIGSSLPAVTLALDSYQFGFTNTTTIGSGTTGAGAGKAKFDELTISAPMSQASPQLFAVLALGDHYDTAVLTQRNAAGKPVAEWVLDTVFLTSDGIKNDSAAVPTETLHLAFGALSEVTATHSASWSQVENTPTGPTPPTGVTLAALPARNAPALTLELRPSSDSSLPAVTLALDSYQFGFENTTTIDSATSGAGTGKVEFNDLIVSAPLSQASPQLFAVLATGSHYGTAVLTQHNAAGDPVAQWVLKLVILTSDSITGAAAAVPTETLHLAFGAVTEMATLPVPSAPALTLELRPSSDSSLPAVTLALDSYQFGFQNTTTIGSATSGAGTGKVKFNDLIVSAPLSQASPQLFAVLAAGSHYGTAVLTQHNAAGDPVAQWVLKLVILTSDSITGSAAAVPTETLHLAFGAVTEMATLPVPSATALTLELRPSSDSSLPAVTLALDSYQFSFQNSTTVDSATSGAGTGKVKLNDLIVSAPLSQASPQLFAVLATGSHYDTAVLTQRNAAGEPVAEWALDTIFLTSDGITGSGAAVPTETIHLAFGAVTEVTATHSASWDQVDNTPTGPTPPTDVTLAPLGPVTPRVAITAAGGVYSGTAFGVSAATVFVGNTTLASLGDSSLGFSYYFGPTATGAASATAPTNAGTYTVVAHFSSFKPSFYTDADSSPVVFTITPAPLTITANNQSKITGEANPPFTVGYSGFVAGQGPGVLGGSLTFSTTATTASPPGIYTITPAGLTSGNYAISFVSGTLIVLSDSQATSNVLAQIKAASIPAGIGNSLSSQLQAAIDSFNRGKASTAVNQLWAFIQHVNAQRGKQLDAALADLLIAAAQRIINAVH